jgi:hypothetical protein
MKHIAVLVGTLFFASPLFAETPCDFKGISVGDKMSASEVMSALGPNIKRTQRGALSSHLKRTRSQKNMD